MSYSLSFSPEFFLAEGEPYDRKELALNEKGQPTSVYSALCLMHDHEPAEWARLAKEVYQLAPHVFLNPDTVLATVCETNTCSNIDSPVEVWIDPEGDFRVKVYE